MKVIVKFTTREHKSAIIAPFINNKNAVITEEYLIIPKQIKIVYDTEEIICYCQGLHLAEAILSSICKISVDEDNNVGEINFPDELSNVILETEIKDFDSLLDLAATGHIGFINTELHKLQANVKLSKWLSADIAVDDKNSYIDFKFNSYQIIVNDNSALRFCTRVKQHPLVSASILMDYFSFGDEVKPKPKIEYLCFYKMLKSDGGYKKYSNFINECNDLITVLYDDGKKYLCTFEGGKIEFQLISIGDKYPKKIILQFDKLNKDILLSLQKNLNLKSVELVSKITSLKLTSEQLLKDLHFFKSDQFFMFSNVYDKLNAEYDISLGTMIIKREIPIDELEETIFQEALDKTKIWINKLLDKANE